LKLVLFCLSVGLSAGETKGTPPDPITLYTQFEHKPSQAILEALEHEVEAIMAPIGLRLEWRSLMEVRGSEVSAELAVITVKGRCAPTAYSTTVRSLVRLDSPTSPAARFFPFAEVNCDRVRNFLQADLILLAPEERDRAFGRALGRVLAHELYHVLANTIRHGSGVANENYTVHDLLCAVFQFELRESQMLRGRRLRLLGDAGTENE
jgi:hypothetical protein